MKNRTTRFLITSLILIVILCTVIFSFLAIHMNNQSTQTVNEVASLYMSSVCEQISMHFETTISLQLDEVESLMKTISSDNIHENEEAQKDLITSAKALNFSYLGFYNKDNEFEMLYGSQLSVTDPQPFMSSLSNGDKKVAVGEAADGQKVILLGIPSQHTHQDNTHSCVALVGALPVSYITNTLSLEENSNHVYSFIIRQDGSFVIRSSDAYRSNYFNRVLEMYDNVNGSTPAQYLEELKSAMANDEEYSSEFVIHGERRHLYCTHLAYSEWYLLTFMPYNIMDPIVSDLNQQWATSAIVSGGIILLALLLVFSIYFRLTRKQLIALNQARQEAEEAMREAEHANKAKSEFLSNMSHDIRTPMNAIVGMTAIATANLDDPQQIQNCLKKITLSSKHLLGLINDVLDMSKIESGKMTLSIDEISLREVMDSIVSIVQPQVRAKHQHFDVFIHDISAENVCCDSVRLNQVLLNFLSNAIKFTPEGGSITVSLYEEESPKGEEFVRIHLRVKDTGIGMSPEFQSKIFDSFTREDNARVHRTEGTGLGMAITKYIVDAMGGTIEVESELGKGSEFHVTLDMERAEVPEVDMILPNWNMLVVDDDSQLCESTVASLKDIGVNAEWTLDAETALEMVAKRHQQRDDYHIIMLDWKLPGMDGIEAARRIRQEMGEHVPILLISAYDWSEIEAEAKEAGITGFISKPLFKSTLFYGLRPFTGQTDEPEHTIQEEPAADLSGMHVLLAEDNELNWEIAHDLLSELGLELDWAENGQECLEKFEQSEPGYYSAILMDIRMPVMNGYEATIAIRALHRTDADIPIIAMTADAFAEDVQKCLRSGMNAHVAKPIDVRELTRLLTRLTQR